jgi:hypothetical protein
MFNLPIEEYFRYHPPNTIERKTKHEQVNNITLEIAKQLIDLPRGTKIGEIERICDELRKFVRSICADSTCQKWANKAIIEASMGARMRNDERILMNIQQCRMFLNQGIVVDELLSMK